MKTTCWNDNWTFFIVSLRFIIIGYTTYILWAWYMLLMWEETLENRITAYLQQQTYEQLELKLEQEIEIGSSWRSFESWGFRP